MKFGRRLLGQALQHRGPKLQGEGGGWGRLESGCGRRTEDGWELSWCGTGGHTFSLMAYFQIIPHLIHLPPPSLPFVREVSWLMRTTYISKDSDVVRQQGLKEKEVKALKQVWREVGTF